MVSPGLVRRVAASACLMIILAAPRAGADDPYPWVGARVFLLPGVSRKVNGKSPNPSGILDRPDTAFRVEKAEVPWLWLVSDWDGTKGLARDEQVVPCDRAVDYYSGKIAIDPSAVNYLLRAGAHLSRSEFAGAVADYDQVLRLVPGTSFVFHNRGRALSAMAEHDRAIADFNEAIRLESWRGQANRSQAASHVLHARAGSWAAKGDAGKAIADLSEAIRLDPTRHELYWDRADVRIRTGNYPEAIADLSEAIRLAPTSGKYFRLRGWARTCAGEHVTAILDYTEAIRLDPKSIEGYALRSEALLFTGEPAQALADYNEWVRLDPKSADARGARGRVYSEEGEYAKADADFAEALALDPKCAHALWSLAALWATCPDERFRDGRKAVDAATRGLAITGESHPSFLETLAAAQAEAGDFSAAVQSQEKAIALNTSPVGQAIARDRLALYRAGTPYRQPPHPR